MMNALLEAFRNVDLAAVAERLVALVDATDPCFLALLLGVATLLGSKMASGYPALVSWGLRLGVATFLVYGGYAWVTQGGLTTDQLLPVGVRGLIAAGLVVAPLWICLPVLAFVYGRLRLALAAFLGYAAYECFSQGEMDVEGLGGLGVRSLIAAALALVIAWILQPVLDVLALALPARLRKQTPAATPPAPRAEEGKPPAEAQPAPTRADLDREADSQRRRRRARFKAELCFTLHEPVLGDRFSRAMFEDFTARYLGDGNRPEDVEEYARELEVVIRQHAAAGQGFEPLDLTDLTRWLLEEQRRIQAAEADAVRKKTQLAGLNRRYTQLAEQILDEPPGEN
jgi:hypothetical protein